MSLFHVHHMGKHQKKTLQASGFDSQKERPIFVIIKLILFFLGKKHKNIVFCKFFQK